MLYRVQIAGSGLELTTLVVIGTACIGSNKSNYHAITTRTVPHLFVGGLCFIYVICIYLRFPYQMMFMSFIINIAVVTCGTRTAHPSGAPVVTPPPPDFRGVGLARYLVFYVMFLRLLNASLVSSNVPRFILIYTVVT